MAIELYFSNTGYAAPVKFRPVLFVLTSEDGSLEHRFQLATDIRFWRDAVTIEESLSLPNEVQQGTYDISILIPDSHESIADRPEYAIRLANVGLWNEENGYNQLNISLLIE